MRWNLLLVVVATVASTMMIVKILTSIFAEVAQTRVGVRQMQEPNEPTSRIGQVGILQEIVRILMVHVCETKIASKCQLLYSVYNPFIFPFTRTNI